MSTNGALTVNGLLIVPPPFPRYGENDKQKNEKEGYRQNNNHRLITCVLRGVGQSWEAFGEPAGADFCYQVRSLSDLSW